MSCGVYTLQPLVLVLLVPGVRRRKVGRGRVGRRKVGRGRVGRRKVGRGKVGRWN